MRILVAIVLACSALVSIALADDGFIVDTRDPAAQGKSYSFTDGELRVSDRADAGKYTLLVIRLTGGPLDGQLAVFTIHPGASLSYPLHSEGASGGKPFGAVQLREFSTAAGETEPATSPEVAAMLGKGKRFVINNLELVIYAPGSQTFHAEIFSNTGDVNDVTRTLLLPTLSDQPAPGVPPSLESQGWISGSL
jgi:hypothetical protein